jgi:molybdopterin biosynthesis enzyme MoaB
VLPTLHPAYLLRQPAQKRLAWRDFLELKKARDGMTERPFIPVRIAVLTVSDTRTIADDKSGQVLADRIVAAGHLLADRAIVTDDVERIRAQVRAWAERADVDAVISTGGTGLTGAT